MACTESILARCPDCNSEDIKRNGKSRTYLQRYVCNRCSRSFQTSYHYRAWKPEVRALIVPMAMRNSGIRDIENVLGIHRDSVMAVIKAEADKIPVEPLPTKKQKVATAELDEFWSFAPAQRRTSDGHGMPGMYAKNASWHIRMVAVQCFVQEIVR